MATWVFAQETDGALESNALEALTAAREWDDAPAAFYVGPAQDDVFAELGAHGAGHVYHLDPGDALPAATAAAALAEAVAADTPDLILFGPANTDRDVAGRLSARLDQPVITNAVGLEVGTDGVTVTKRDARRQRRRAYQIHQRRSGSRCDPTEDVQRRAVG